MTNLHKINLLAFAAHPDDVEISAAGIMIKHQVAGLKTGVVDLSRGELGTRGNAEIRRKESERASEIMQLAVRENLGIADGFIEESKENLMKVIRVIRKYRPDIILINAERDRHPDHGKANQLVSRAVFLSGLKKIETGEEGKKQEVWRPGAVYSYIQDYFLEPDLIIDVSQFWQKRMDALMAYSSQFYDPDSGEPVTPISTPEFLKNIEGRAVQLARYIGCSYAEGLKVQRPVGAGLLNQLI